MKSINLIMTVLIFFFIACSDEKETPPVPNPETLAEDIENLIVPIIQNENSIGVAVGVMRPGGRQEMYFFGEKVKGEGITSDENTIYEIGSITKTMTATVLADMIINGEIELDDPIKDYLGEEYDIPSFDDSEITFKDLANHTSSLPPLPDNFFHPDFNEDQPYIGYTEDMLVNFLSDYNLPYEPGTVQGYSNLGMGILGHTISGVRSTDLFYQLQKTVFDQLNMDNTYTVLPDSKSNMAQPYDKDLRAVPMWDMSNVTIGAGGVKSSLKDMMKYLEANLGYGDSPIKEALELTHQNTQTLNHPYDVGLAWNNVYKADDGTTLRWHDGGTAGTTTFLGFVKELDMGVILLFNTEVNERTGDDVKVIQTGIDIIQAMKKYE